MTDVSFALEAKSDQLNAVDIQGAEPVIHIRDVVVKQGDQPISVYFDGDNGRPWKPSKGMARILAAAWGRDSSQWVGRYVQLYFEPTVKYAGKEVGGIRIRAMSDIPEQGINCTLTINRQQRDTYHVPLLSVQTAEYPADKFDAAFPKMRYAMANGDMTLQQVIARCQQTGNLTGEQMRRLEEAAPVEVGEEGEEEDEFT